jgi:hypothetical protein
MTSDILLKVLGYAVIPLVMAGIGNNLASEVIHNPRRRKMYRSAFLVLVILGISGAWIVEWRSEAAHTMEITENGKAISHLQETLTATQLQSANDMGYLKGRLDAAIDRPEPDMSKLASAITASSSALIRAQIKIQSAAELKVQAIQLAQDMRAFESQYTQREYTMTISETLSRAPTPLQKSEDFKKATIARVQMMEQEKLEFRDKFLVRAITVRDEMIAKIGDTKELPNFPQNRLIAFSGFLGVST